MTYKPEPELEAMIEETKKLVEDLQKNPEKLYPPKEEICKKLEQLTVFGDTIAEQYYIRLCTEKER